MFGFGDLFGNPGGRRTTRGGYPFEDVYGQRSAPQHQHQHQRSPYGQDPYNPYGYGGYPEELVDPYSRSSRAQQQQIALERERRLKAQREAEEEQRIMAERRRRAAMEKRKQVEAERAALMFRYTRAAKKIQAWYRAIRAARLSEKQQKSATVVTRFMKKAGPCVNAKKVADSLRKLQAIEKEIANIILEANTTVLENYSNTKQDIKLRLITEDKLEKAILKMDSVPTYGNDFVRLRRKEIVAKAQRGLETLDDLDTKFSPPTPSPTPMVSSSEGPRKADPEVQKMQLEAEEDEEKEEVFSDSQQLPMSNSQSHHVDLAALEDELASLQRQIQHQLQSFSTKIQSAGNNPRLNHMQKQVSDYLAVMSKPFVSLHVDTPASNHQEPSSPGMSKKKNKKNKHHHKHHQ